jgi:hypothetical protein
MIQLYPDQPNEPAVPVYKCDICDDRPAEIHRLEYGIPHFVCTECFEDKRFDR